MLRFLAASRSTLSYPISQLNETQTCASHGDHSDSKIGNFVDDVFINNIVDKTADHLASGGKRCAGLVEFVLEPFDLEVVISVFLDFLECLLHIGLAVIEGDLQSSLGSKFGSDVLESMRIFSQLLRKERNVRAIDAEDELECSNLWLSSNNLENVLESMDQMTESSLAYK